MYLLNPDPTDATSTPFHSAISVRDVSKVFGPINTGFRALDDVSVEIANGEFFTLLGPSGCGKTTLLRLLAGFEQPTSGSIRLDGEDIASLPPFKRPVNTVFQSYALFPHMTVRRNIAFGLEMLGKPEAEIASTVAEMLALVQMEPMADRKITEISGGQQQRVALARALAPRPKLLLLDEPLSALDLVLRRDMQLELKRMQRETGITFVFVTHDQDEALTMSNRIAVMNKGRILQVGTPRDIYDRPQHRFVAGFIGEINLVPAKPAGGNEYAVAGVGSVRVANPGKTTGDAMLAIRPERVSLGAPSGQKSDENRLGGTLTEIVYRGTDTLYHFDLADGTPMRSRRQNATAAPDGLTAGDAIEWWCAPDAVSVLPDGAE